MVTAGGVAEFLGEEIAHDPGDLGIDRRGRAVVQVNRKGQVGRRAAGSRGVHDSGSRKSRRNDGGIGITSCFLQETRCVASQQGEYGQFPFGLELPALAYTKLLYLNRINTNL
jgi:hypothetical protein